MPILLKAQPKIEEVPFLSYQTYVFDAPISDVSVADMLYDKNLYFFGKAKDNGLVSHQPILPWMAVFNSSTINVLRENRNNQFYATCSYQTEESLQGKSFDNVRMTSKGQILFAGDLLMSLRKENLAFFDKQEMIVRPRSSGDHIFGSFFMPKSGNSVALIYRAKTRDLVLQMLGPSGSLYYNNNKNELGAMSFGEKQGMIYHVNPEPDKDGKYFALVHHNKENSVGLNLLAFTFKNQDSLRPLPEVVVYNLMKPMSAEMRTFTENALKNFVSYHNNDFSFDEKGDLVWQFESVSGEKNELHRLFFKCSTDGNLLTFDRNLVASASSKNYGVNNVDAGFNYFALIYTEANERTITASKQQFSFNAAFTNKSTGQLVKHFRFTYPVEQMKNDFLFKETDTLELRGFSVAMVSKTQCAVVFVIESQTPKGLKNTHFVLRIVDF